MKHNPNYSGDSLESMIQVLGSKEYGASKLAFSVAQYLELDRILFSQPVEWREDALAMVIGKLIFSLKGQSLMNVSSDTMLWELCGYSPDKKPELNKNWYNPLVELLCNKECIQESLITKHLRNKTAILFDLTLWDEALESEKVHAGLLTNTEGCPIGIEFFSEHGMQNQIEALLKTYQFTSIFVVSDTHTSFKKEIELIKLVTPAQFVKNNLQEIYPGSFDSAITFQRTQQISQKESFNACLFLDMLACYLEWHIKKQMESYFQEQGKTKPSHWSLSYIIERMKCVRSQILKIENNFGHAISELDSEQSEMISIFGLKPEDF